MTPGGKLEGGDIIRNKSTKREWRVLERLGNDMLYSVRITPVHYEERDWHIRRDRGIIMSAAAYQIQCNWELVK